MLIFVETVNERLTYAFDFIFKERDLNYRFTSDESEFEQYSEPKFNYSNKNLGNAPSIVPSSILFEKNITNYSIDLSLFNKEECFSLNGICDPVACIFYILTRYEEYQSKFKDKHGRHIGKKSVLYQFGWHEKAVCDRWSENILFFISSQTSFRFEKKKYSPQIIPTFDIDKAYAYKHKGIFRNILGYLKDFYSRDTKRTKERRMVLSGSKKDPFDNYDKIFDIQGRGFDVKLFWMLGNYGKYDKNISHKNRRHRRLIRKMDTIASIGIHPSYRSNANEFNIHSEIERLQSIIKKHVRSSRQHYLMLLLPQTYQQLIEQEIQDDYSMGYADIIGFRAGTARSFHWFDLTKNKKTALRVHPFCYMDGSLNEYLQLSTNEAEERIAQLYIETQNYGGQFIFLWHNDTISDYGHWAGWSKVLEFSLRLHELQES